MMNRFTLYFSISILFIVVISSTTKKGYLENSDSKIIKVNEVSKFQDSNQIPWFRNAIYGISVLTPKQLQLLSAKIPQGYEDYYKKMVLYGSQDKEKNTIIYVTFIQSINQTYDVKMSQESSIGNLVNLVKGTDLRLVFTEIETSENNILCKGTFKIGNLNNIVSSYSYWNGIDKVAIVTCIGVGGNQLSNEIEFKKIINSVKLAF